MGGGVRDGYLTVFTLSRDITGISHFLSYFESGIWVEYTNWDIPPAAAAYLVGGERAVLFALSGRGHRTAPLSERGGPAP